MANKTPATRSTDIRTIERPLKFYTKLLSDM